MTATPTYSPTQKMSDLIGDNSALLMVLSRFGISLGFGDQTVAQVCEAHRIDCPTFLAIANFVSHPQTIDNLQTESYSLTALMDYLKQSHSYFLDYRLPAMRSKLAAAVGNSPLTPRILRFFDDYRQELSQHMQVEEETVFRYVERLLQGDADPGYSIHHFSSPHDEIESRLTDLKNILIKYLPEEGNRRELNQVLFDIFSGEADIASHCRIEDHLFIPAVLRLERKLKGEVPQPTAASDTPDRQTDAADGTPTLSERERDIVRCVAMGMSNKEIADALFISIHTVITHRRNIAQKLQIHSPAGLTIYAIVNKIVSIEGLPT